MQRTLHRVHVHLNGNAGGSAKLQHWRADSVLRHQLTIDGHRVLCIVDRGGHGLELALHVLKRVAQGKVHIFVLDPLGHERLAWNRDIKTHAKRSTRTVVIPIKMDGNPALNDLRFSPSKPVGMHFCRSEQRNGRFHTGKPNVDWIVHTLTRYMPRCGLRVGGPFESQIGVISYRLLPTQVESV